jgi:hypothetical protein
MNDARTEKPMMTEISEDEFWDNVNCLPPLLRLGFSDGPGAFMCSEPYGERRCAVTGKMNYSYSVSVVLKNDGKSQFFEHNEHMTINEFKAFCDRVMPGVGVCGMGWGEKLLDADGNLRGNLEYLVRRP